MKKIYLAFVYFGFCSLVMGADLLDAADQDSARRASSVFDALGRTARPSSVLLVERDPLSLTEAQRNSRQEPRKTKNELIEEAHEHRADAEESKRAIPVAGAITAGAAGALALGLSVYSPLLYAGALGMFALAGLFVWGLYDLHRTFIQAKDPFTFLLVAAAGGIVEFILSLFLAASLGLGVAAAAFPATWGVGALGLVAVFGFIATVSFIDQAVRGTREAKKLQREADSLES